MQFNSFSFILVFLPVILLAYFLLSRIHPIIGKLVLILGSIYFYCAEDWKTGIFLGISVAVNYIFAVLIRRLGKPKKLLLFFPVLINVGLLLYFKYTNFLITNLNKWVGTDIALRDILLPVGISFFTFQQIAYLVAVYRDELENVDLLDYLTFILYFPKLLMGPLADPVNFIGQLRDPERKKFRVEGLVTGIKIFSFGLFKKLLFADVFALAVNWGFEHMDAATSMDWIIIMFCYTFEIYFDFSGYSDMAVGVSRMLGIDLPMNFDSPYKAVSVRDFWKRWHMSLTGFFTKYIYFPLGGSRKGELRTYLNTMIIFLISGIWHGANWTFILWGLIYGGFMVFDRVLDRFKVKPFEPFRWLLTFLLVSVLWLMFRADSLGQWEEILKKMLSLENLSVSPDLVKCFMTPEIHYFSVWSTVGESLTARISNVWMWVYLAFAAVVCFVPENNYRNLKKLTVPSMLLAAVAFVWAFCSLSAESVFVYFGF